MKSDSSRLSEQDSDKLLHISAGHHRSHSSGHSGIPTSRSSSHLSLLDRRKSGSSVVISNSSVLINSLDPIF